jgi:hypothetical protein
MKHLLVAAFALMVSSSAMAGREASHGLDPAALENAIKNSGENVTVSAPKLKDPTEKLSEYINACLLQQGPKASSDR